MSELDQVRRIVAGTRARWPLFLMLCLAGPVAGVAAAVTFVPSMARAQITVDVEPNTGGSSLNSYPDASMASIQWVQPAQLHAARVDLTGAALADVSALDRVHCSPETKTFVTCSTTSSNPHAARAVLNQLVAIAIPIQAQMEIGALKETVGEEQEQLELPRMKLVRNQSIRVDIIGSIASLQRQIRHAQASFVVVGHGATSVQLPRTMNNLAGGAVGLLGSFLLVPYLAWKRGHGSR